MTKDIKQEIERDIVTGALTPGTRLDETSLAQRFGVSRTPVREALHQLSTIGLIEIRPRRGAFVRKIGLKALVEMFEVMAELEGMCGRLAAKRMTPEELANLQQLHDASKPLVEARAYDDYYLANVHFHECIYAGSHNGYLAEQTMALRNRLTPYRRLQLRQVDRIGKSFEEHADILAAIQAGDADLADQRLQMHVSVQQGSFNDFVASLPLEYLEQTG